MFLSSLRIRGKLTLLVVIPLLMMVGLVVPVVRGLITDAGKATDIDAVAAVTGRVGPLLEDLQRERLLSVGFLLGVVTRNDLELQTATMTDRVRDVQRELGDTLPDAERGWIARIGDLAPVREQVRSRATTPYQVLDAYAPLVDGMIDSLGLVSRADAGTAVGAQLMALDALLRLNESNNNSVALLAVMAGGPVEAGAVRYRDESVRFDTYSARFAALATPAQVDLFTLVSMAFDKRLGQDFDTRFEADPVATMTALSKADLFPSLRSFTVLGGFATKRLVDDVAALATEQQQRQLTFAYVIGALVLTVLLGVLILVAIVARAVAVPLTQLSRAAERVAEAGEQELRRVADDESEHVEPVRFDALDLDSKDEIGDLARVFERVQSTASQLVERQVLSRRNVAEMFGHIGRRTQNLVGGQVDLIDELENEETDTDRLAKLYRLDHIANRLRRSADSLVVISGAEREETRLSPVRLVDAVRLALAEIEEYTRVDLSIPIELRLAPAVVNDMVLICGELLENATSFSPPHTRVTVDARIEPRGVRLVVTDHGIGLPDERLAEENARLALRERLDLVPTQVLGLFVVGRLARRHNLTVMLSHTAGGGVTVDVGIRAELLAEEPVRAAPIPVEVPLPVSVPMVVHQPRHLTQRPPNVRAALSRAKEAIGDNSPWNGFGLPQPGLRQRVPGAQLPPATGPAVAGHVPAIADAVAAKDFAEAFQAGVRSAQAAVVPVIAPGPPEETMRTLNRRVPGATLSPYDAPARQSARPLADHDPDAARALVEQFELGVTRALHEA